MAILLIIFFVLCLLIIIGCLFIRGAMIRAFEEKHGLTGLANMIKEARLTRTATRTNLHTFEIEVSEVSNKLEQIEREISKIDQQLSALPKQVYELVFVIGHAAPGVTAYDFIVTRTRRPSAQGAGTNIERDIWTKQRLLQVFARNQSNAVSVAQGRFSEPDGFSLRTAERAIALEAAHSSSH